MRNANAAVGTEQDLDTQVDRDTIGPLDEGYVNDLHWCYSTSR